jgi:ribonuclease P protein component
VNPQDGPQDARLTPRALRLPLRLRSRAQFQAVLAGGIVARTAHFALHRIAPDQAQSHPLWHLPRSAMFVPDAPPPVWLGALTPKRWARRAVTRHLIERQVHAVAASSGAAGAYVVRLRAAFARTQFPSAASDALKRAVRAELLQLWNQLPCANC